jgi:DUF971 family protein
MAMPTLTEVARQPARQCVRFAWSDGFSAECPYDELRGYCPCAGCQGHAAGEITFHRPPKPVEPLTIEPVGNYAISILWSDGHATGIYRFDYLRHLCSEPREAS